MNGIGMNVRHVQDRTSQRIDSKAIMARALNGIATRIKARTTPRGAWYRTVSYKGAVVGHICGTGVYVSTVLAADMAPRGTRI